MNILFSNIAAIDIGSSGIRMVKVKAGLNNFQIQSLSYENYDSSVSERKDAVALALGKILKDDPIDTYKVITNIPMEQVIIRNLTFPFNDPQKIADAIPFEAAENVPFSPDELAMDFKYIGVDDSENGSVILAAAQKEYILEYMDIFRSAGLVPQALGFEADSLLACYNHLSTVKEETVLQVHIGAAKTIVNIIRNGTLLYTRCLSVGTSISENEISSYLKISTTEASKLLQNIDITSFENNQKKSHYSSIKPTQMKKVYQIIVKNFESLLAQINITIDACRTENSLGNINRLVFSGGGANIQGVSSFLSKSLDIPAVPLPFLPGYDDAKINSVFSVALGMVLSYVVKKNSSINFLKSEFAGSMNAGGKRVYYLSAFFLGMTVIILLLNFIISFAIGSSSSSRYEDVLAKNYQKYFADKSNPSDVIKAATEKLNKEKKEYNSLFAVIGEDGSSIEMMYEVISNFEHDSTFDLKNFVINETHIRIDGLTASSSAIDRFKEKLQQTGLFESVTIPNTTSRGGSINFTLDIKKKKKNNGK